MKHLCSQAKTPLRSLCATCQRRCCAAVIGECLFLTFRERFPICFVATKTFFSQNFLLLFKIIFTKLIIIIIISLNTKQYKTLFILIKIETSGLTGLWVGMPQVCL